MNNSKDPLKIFSFKELGINLSRLSLANVETPSLLDKVTWGGEIFQTETSIVDTCLQP